MEERLLDGNAIGGMLGEIFSAEMTGAGSCCATCGASEPVGALRVYVGGPGAVVRCPQCTAVLIRVVRGPSQVWLDLRGVSYLELRLG